ncbi:curli assembly protein CsgF [Aliiglaciecola lipolytica]|uniref:Curli production assembly/transport component CsgF n=1 Tax=Aliiglaciecola lipolytica E3 TaxID=1127673 RepID=K6XRZ2_9ALTE|nr:curli assembly protein CsgF [Aliiglaciecola lipolytica]GAC14451.1 curli production assembly/transport component CsgF [Aliiglaciecola lipolytica E3]
MKNKIVITVSFLVAIIATPVFSTELVYEPINPSFGGSPLNGSYLLSKANAQNTHSASSSERTYAESLQDSLERAYINRIVREVTDLAFGEVSYDENGDPVESIFSDDSIFVSGEFQVELITSNPDSIVVEITNVITDEVTIVEIPRFG